jgi:hypothetical protein
LEIPSHHISTTGTVGHTQELDRVRSAIVFMGSRYNSDSLSPTARGLSVLQWWDGNKSLKAYKRDVIFSN